MLGLYVEYIRYALGQTYAVCQVYLFRAYANNVKYMYTSISGHIVDSNGFMLSIYT